MSTHDDAGALIGVDVGGYIVEGELGRGGMGIVYAATHPVIGKRAAIKVLSHELSAKPSTAERFLQEARSVNQIGHPNIVDIFAFGTLPDGRSYLVMDLLDGEPLRRRIKRGPVPVAEAFAIVDEIASALSAAHDKGFIHRDLKPDNVFLVVNPARVEIRLLDFGLAKTLPTAVLERAYRTATGAQIGTPDYMSPEQLRGSGVDHRTDIYALGILAFEVLTLTRPHRFADGSFDLEGMTFRQALLAVPGVPSELAELVDAMIARDSAQRPTLAAIRAVIKRLRPSLPASAALSNVRPVGSEMSIGSFTPSHLGARPMAPFPHSQAETPLPREHVHEPRAHRVSSQPQPGSHTPRTSGLASSPDPDEARTLAFRSNATPRMPTPTAPPPAPSPASASSGLRPAGGALPSTVLGVPPPPVRHDRPHPVAAARARPVNPVWLVLGAVVVAAAIVLAIVLAT